MIFEQLDFLDLLEEQGKEIFFALKQCIVTEEKNSDGHCGEKQGGVSSKGPYEPARGFGVWGQPASPDLGWEELHIRREEGKKVRVQICYSPSLKRTEFLGIRILSGEGIMK